MRQLDTTDKRRQHAKVAFPNIETLVSSISRAKGEGIYVLLFLSLPVVVVKKKEKGFLLSFKES